MHQLEQYLHSKQIKYVCHEHPAVFTCEDADRFCVLVPGLVCKNLFLRDKKKTRFFLVVLPATQQFELSTFADVVGVSRLSFASSETLHDKLGVYPGAVSPFGLINNTQHDVEVYIGKDVYDAPVVSFHPNRNTASLELTQEMFHRFLTTVENKVQVLE